MFNLKLQNKQKNKSMIDRGAFIFGLVTVFLSGIGFTIIMPIVPFLVKPYVSSSGEQAIMVTLLTSVYALCVFFMAPALGALSDRYGRRPILLICLLGSVVGYLVFGIGGALWVLFVGRIIDGITGGNISTIFAYFADITPREQRTKYFGWVSAVTGVGCAIGPTIGGLLARFGYSIPMYFGATITLLSFIYGVFYMPETLKEDNRLKEITFIRLNPFAQLQKVFYIKNLSRLLIAAILLWIANGSLQGIFSQFIMNSFNWGPILIGLMFSIMGVQDMVSQSFIMPKLLLKFSDLQIVILGMTSEVIGYALIAVSAIFSFYPIFIIGMFIFAFGDSIFGPSFNGILSKSGDSSEQGMIQGGSQALQSIARVVGPIIGGEIYAYLDHSAPAIMGVILIGLAIPILYRRKF